MKERKQYTKEFKEGAVRLVTKQDRAQVEELAQSVQAVTDEAIEVAFVDQGYAGEVAATRLRGLRQIRCRHDN